MSVNCVAVCVWGLTWKFEIWLRSWLCKRRVRFTHDLQRAHLSGSCCFVIWIVLKFEWFWWSLTCVFTPELKGNVYWEDTFSVLSFSPSLAVSSVRNVCLLPSGVSPDGKRSRVVSSEPRRWEYICVEGVRGKVMAFISFVFKWNSPDFSLLSDTLINSSMLSLYIKAWADRTEAKQTNLVLLPWERFPHAAGVLSLARHQIQYAPTSCSFCEGCESALDGAFRSDSGLLVVYIYSRVIIVNCL